MTKQTKQQAPRGYLLAEAMVAGAMVAVTLGIVFSQIASSRADIVYGQRHAIASSQAAAKASELAGASVLATQPLNAFSDIDPAAYPGMKIRWSVTPSTVIMAASNPPISSALFDVLVEVTVPTRSGVDTISYRTIQKD